MHILLGILIFKRLIVRRLYKSFGVKGLINDWHFATDSASKLLIFMRFRNIAKSDCYLRHGCPSVRTEQSGPL
jgi:hypothetical protein